MNPNTSAIINGVFAVVGAIAAMKPDMFPAYIPGDVSVSIIQTCGMAMVFFGAVNGALHLTSSSSPGALGK
jgi:hypothetical protein